MEKAPQFFLDETDVAVNDSPLPRAEQFYGRSLTFLIGM